MKFPALKGQAGVAAGILAVVVAVVAVANFANLQLSGNALYTLTAGASTIVDYTPYTAAISASPCTPYDPNNACAYLYLTLDQRPTGGVLQLGPFTANLVNPFTSFEPYGYKVVVQSMGYFPNNFGGTEFRVGLDVTECPAGQHFYNSVCVLDSTTTTTTTACPLNVVFNYPSPSSCLCEGFTYNSGYCCGSTSATAKYYPGGCPSSGATNTLVTGTATPTTPVIFGSYKIYAADAGVNGPLWTTIIVKDFSDRELARDIISSQSGQLNYVTFGFKLTVTQNLFSNNVFTGALITVEANPVASTTPTVPSAPQNLAATPGNGQVNLLWMAPSNTGGAAITNYKIYRGTSSATKVLVATPGNVLTFTDTGLTNGQQYFYAVSAVNSVGESLRSDAAATPLSSSPSPAPTTVSGTATPTNPVIFGNYKIYASYASGAFTYITIKDSTDRLLEPARSFTPVQTIEYPAYGFKITVTGLRTANGQFSGADITVESLPVVQPPPTPKDVLETGFDIAADTPETLSILSGQPSQTGIIDAWITTSSDIAAADARIEVTQEIQPIPAFPSPEQSEFKILKLVPSAGLAGKITQIQVTFKLTADELGLADPSTVVLGRFVAAALPNNGWEEFPTGEGEVLADGSRVFVSIVPPELGLFVIATKACTDSDLGENFDIKGTVRGLDPVLVGEAVDYCGTAGLETGKLVEYVCGSDYSMQKVLSVCLGGCGEGRCLPPPAKLAHWTFEADTIVTNPILGLVEVHDTVGGSSAVMHDGDLPTLTADAPAKISGQGVFGQAVKFDGLDDSLQIQDDTQLNIGLIDKELTVSAWVNLRTRDGAPFKTILVKPALALDPPVLYSLNFDRDNKKVNFALSKGHQGSLAAVTSATEIPLNAWTLVTGVWDGQIINIYINGRFEASVPFTGPIGTSEKPIYIGSGEVAGATNFDGIIDDVQIYNYGLADQDVAALCSGKCLGIVSPSVTPSDSASPTPSTTPPPEIPVKLLALWKADEGTGIEVKDHSTGNKHLTISKDGSEITPSWIIGKFDDGLSFDGSNGLVSISGDTELNPTDLTISAWVQTRDTGSMRGVVSRGATLQVTDERLDYALAIDKGVAKFIVQSRQGTIYQVSGGSVSDGNWHLLVGTFDSATKELKIYVDGSLKDITASASMNLFSTNIVIGGGGGTTNKLKGLIDEVRLYKGVLSDAMIEALYNIYTKDFSEPTAATTELAKSSIESSEDGTTAAPIDITVPPDVAAKAAVTKISIEVSGPVPKAAATLEIKALDKIPVEDEKSQKLTTLPLVEQPLTKIIQLSPSAILSPLITRATIKFTLTKTELGSTDPSKIVLARFVNGAWEELPTTASAPLSDGSIEFSATTTGFSVFVVTTSVTSTLPSPAPSPTPTPTPTATTPPASGGGTGGSSDGGSGGGGGGGGGGGSSGGGGGTAFSPTPTATVTPQRTPVQTQKPASPVPTESTVQIEQQTTADDLIEPSGVAGDYTIAYIAIILILASVAGIYIFRKKAALHKLFKKNESPEQPATQKP